MVHVIVRHKVADFAKWKQAFDAYLNRRMAAGETGFRVFQSIDDPRDVTVFTDWESMEHARRFMQSDDLRKAMQKRRRCRTARRELRAGRSQRAPNIGRLKSELGLFRNAA